MNVEVVVWGMKAGIVTELMFEGDVFVLRQNEELLVPKPVVGSDKVSDKIVDKTDKKQDDSFYAPATGSSKRNVKISYLEKWIQRGKMKVFTLEDYFRVYPGHRQNYKLNGHIAKLISRKVIVQLGKERFRVVGR